MLPDKYNQKILETERLLLRELNPEIMHYLFTDCSDEDMCAYMGFTPDELAVEKYKFEKGLSTHQTSYKNFVMVDKASSKVLGRAGFHTWFAKHSRAEIGYIIRGEENKRKGYMTEALKAILKHGYEAMGLNRVEALVGPGNAASLKLVRNLGFTEEGTLREHYYMYPTVQDSVCFSLLKREYELVKDKW